MKAAKFLHQFYWNGKIRLIKFWATFLLWRRESQSKWNFSVLFWRKIIEQFHWLGLEIANQNQNWTHCRSGLIGPFFRTMFVFCVCNFLRNSFNASFCITYRSYVINVSWINNDTIQHTVSVLLVRTSTGTSKSYIVIIILLLWTGTPSTLHTSTGQVRGLRLNKGLFSSTRNVFQNLTRC